MNRLLLAISALSLIASLTVSAQQPSSPTPLLVGGGPQSGPADARVFISNKEIQDRIAQAAADVQAGRKYSGEPLVMQGPFRATMEWRNTKEGGVDLHEKMAELFVILDGSATWNIGGTMVNPKLRISKNPVQLADEGPTWSAKSVIGGIAYNVTKGDVILIPPNTAHYVSRVDHTLVLWSMHLPVPLSSSAPYTVDPKNQIGVVQTPATAQ